ncbi:MAG: urea ABC transporter substrate-binding protein [Mariprofundus sp.]|nr:urea ABC transporter substrate-binding protein [Mariprofundus sp.]
MITTNTKAWLLTLLLLANLLTALPSFAKGYMNTTEIRVGILHSLTGTMAASEKPVVDATLLAIEQINAKGGLLGHLIEVVIADGKSEESVFAHEAERLITEEHVNVIFGCWSSASRKAVLPIIEKYNNLLFYPMQYEGLEASHHIIYTGALPNQQILPTVSWAMSHLGKRIYLLGSDAIFSHAANWLIKKQLSLLQGQVVGERYIPLGSNDMDAVITDIRKLAPDLILNTISGNSNNALFHALKRAAITANQTPVISFSLDAAGMRAIPVNELLGHYAAWSYFSTIDNKINRQFTHILRNKLGDTPITASMESAWIGVNLWADAVRGAQTWNPLTIQHSVLNQSFHAPEAVVTVDPVTHHLWKSARIGKITSHKTFAIVWSSRQPQRPFPYPLITNHHDAKLFIKQLNLSWHGRWSAPTDTQKAKNTRP